MPSASDLLARARQAYDAPASPLPTLARRAWTGGFAGGGHWMAAALSQLRGDACGALPLVAATSFRRLGMIKYGLALAAALLVLAAAIALRQPMLTFLAVPAFYAVEVQMLFLFPVAIDASAHPFRDSRRWMRRAGGTARTVPVVMHLAAHMLFGGLLGLGALRAWCTGCLAVCIWYEDVRRAATHTPKPPPLFEVFGCGPLTLRTEDVRVSDVAAESRPERHFRLLYASDLHLGQRWTRRVPSDLANIARGAAPGAIVLGGDLLDTAAGSRELSALVRELGVIAPTYAMPGNHELRVGVDFVRRVVEEAGGRWLDGSTVSPTDGVSLAGAAGSQTNSGNVRVLCTHDPAIFATPASDNFNLVLAGHLHGGQCVLYRGRRTGRLYPGAWINRWTGPRFVRDRTTMLVSAGVGDSFPLRWNCPREVLLCRIYY